MKCCLLLYATTNHFSIGCDVRPNGLYKTTSNDQLRGWTKKQLQSTSQSQTCTKKRSWSLFGGLLPNWSTTLSESQWHHYTWEVCSANRRNAMKTAMPEASTGQQNGPNSPRQCATAPCTTSASKVEWIGLWSFASSAIFTWPLANWLPLFQAPWELFEGKMLPKLAGGRKCFPIHWVLKHGFLCYGNKPTYFSLAKMLTVMVPILINKDVFEPTIII